MTTKYVVYSLRLNNYYYFNSVIFKFHELHMLRLISIGNLKFKDTNVTTVWSGLEIVIYLIKKRIERTVRSAIKVGDIKANVF